MKRVLLLAYYFPPIGGAGAQRPVKFVRHLPGLGYEPIVVTGPGDSIGRWTPADETLTADIPPETQVVRVPGPEPQGAGTWSARWGSRAERWLGLPSAWSRWWISGAVEVGLQYDDVDVVYSWMSPYDSAEAALRLSKAIGKPWVADLGDPWALDEMMVFPSGLHRLQELGRMRRLLASAAAIVMSTPEAVVRVRSTFPELASKLIVAIPNGFDANDFEEPVSARDDGVFRIVHTGYLHTELGRQQRRTAALHRFLGGETRGVDIMTRSHVYLLQAISRLVEEDASLADRIEVHLAGVLSQSDRDVAAVSPVVRVAGYLSHADSIRLMRSADLLFLPMQNLPPGRRSTTVPGKTYEYLAAGRPILAAIPDGDAREILQAAGNAVICAPNDVDGMAELIRKQLHAERLPAPQTADPRAELFEYEKIATRLASVFDRAVEEEVRPTVPSRGVPVAEPARRRTVLHLAYYFPPIGGAGAQRSLKFVRYLPDFGYDADVVTGPGELEGRWTPTDTTLNEELPRDTRVRRVRGPEPTASEGWSGRAERWLGVRSAWSRWWVREAARTAGQTSDFEVIMASMSPYDSAEAAARVAKAAGRPWIAGLRDPWALDEMMVFPSNLHRRLELRRMRKALASAAAIVTTTPEAASAVKHAFPELASKPIVSIPNGFDANDFEGPAAARDDGVFRIVHTGYLHTELGRQQRRTAALRRFLGGETRGVDIMTRSHVYLLQAISRLIAEDSSLADRIEVHLAGVLSESDREIAAMSPVVRLSGYVSHAESIGLMRSADLLFLPMQNLPPGRRSTTVPGKTYEYLASGRPILAAIPEGDAREILQAAGNAMICAPDDVEGMVDGLRAQVQRWSEGQPTAAPKAEVLARFERRKLTEDLARALDDILGSTVPLPRPRRGALIRKVSSYATTAR
jgi:glycosyltransferase involved in cell wall biosynthesis